MDNLSLQELREERCWQIIGDMDDYELSQLMTDFIMSSSLKDDFVAMILENYEEDDEDDGEEDYSGEDY